MKRSTNNQRQGMSGIAGLIITPYTFITEEKTEEQEQEQQQEHSEKKQRVLRSSKKRYPSK